MENNDYNLMVSPIEHNGFRSLTKAQAKQYFEWYVEQISPRINQLCQYMQSTNGTAFSCDYTPESLIDLWEWFESQIRVVEKSADEYEAELKRFPSWMHDSISKETMSIKTLALITDISFYFAQTFITQNPSVYWSYFTKPKNEVSVNMPVLMGFQSNMKLDPRRIVHVCALKSCRTCDKKRLFDIYQTWLGYIAK